MPPSNSAQFEQRFLKDGVSQTDQANDELNNYIFGFRVVQIKGNI